MGIRICNLVEIVGRELGGSEVSTLCYGDTARKKSIFLQVPLLFGALSNFEAIHYADL